MGKETKPPISLILALSVVFFSSPTQARVTRLQITSREVVADGLEFGSSGPYEKLRGAVYFAVDPDDPRNAVVFDLDRAQRNKEGMVEFSADFLILKPTDLAKGNGGLFFEVNTRGDLAGLCLMNDTPCAIDTTINSGDMAGVLMIVAQALDKRTVEQTTRIDALTAEKADLKARLEALERRMSSYTLAKAE